MYENTLLIVTSDNGARPGDEDGETYGHRSNGIYTGYKMHIWDGGHRVPFLVSWPATIDAGSRNDDLLVLTDLLPTIGELVGAESPAVDGASRLARWLGRREEAAEEPAVIHHSYYGMFAVRRGRWKYIEQLGSGGSAKPGRVIPKGADPADWPPLVVPHPNAPAGQLYDMIEDPQERRNLWSERPDVVAELHAELERVRGDDAEPMSEEVLPVGERPRRR
jgi:arylsulfatase A-like enzyme